MHLLQFAARAADRYANKTAVVSENKTLTFSELFQQALGVAHELTCMGIEPGDRVGLMLPNSADFVVCYLGILALNAIVVMVPPWCKEEEASHILTDSGSKAVITDAHHESLIRTLRLRYLPHLSLVSTGHHSAPDKHLLSEWMAASSNNPSWSGDGRRAAVILYTAAFEGRARGAVLTHANLIWNAKLIEKAYHVRPADKILCTIPIFHCFGLTCGLNCMLLCRSTGYYYEKFDPEKTLDCLMQEKVTAFFGVPTMFLGMVMAREPDKHCDLSAVRICVSGGAPLSETVYTAFREAFGLSIRQGYGLTEASPVVTLHALNGMVVPGSCGQPLPGITVRIVNTLDQEVGPGQVGEIVIHGNTVMQGYWNRPSDTAYKIRDGWLHTGDLAYRDKNDYYYLVGKKQNFIIRGGLNVYPKEVESLLESHPATAKVKVVGIPDMVWGETVKAFVQLRPSTDVTEGELLEYCKERMAFYKRPHIIEIVDELPQEEPSTSIAGIS